MKKTLAAAVVLLSVTACSEGKDWKAVKPGMSPQEVVGILGQPDEQRDLTPAARKAGVGKTMKGEEFRTGVGWKYRLTGKHSNEAVIVWFINDKVQNYGRRPASEELSGWTIDH